jgi:DNA-binding IclR family transcriptional regulator
LERLTPATITSRAALLEELTRIRVAGVAIDREEHTEGICAVGAVVADPAGPVAAISIPVPLTRCAGHEARYAAAVRAAASAGTVLLGG